jgi:predicted Abi (CAAX) family protease
MTFKLNHYINQIRHRLLSAILTIPSFQAWLISGALVLVYALVSLPVGFYFNFLHFGIVPISWVAMVGIIAICFITPAVMEEMFFRVLLLPQPGNVSLITQLLCGGISLAAFIVYHPLQGLTIYPAAMETFSNPVFLLLAGLLGIICTISYFYSGSLWSAVVIHWIVVVVWLLLLGGYEKLNPEQLLSIKPLIVY